MKLFSLLKLFFYIVNHSLLVHHRYKINCAIDNSNSFILRHTELELPAFSIKLIKLAELWHYKDVKQIYKVHKWHT